MVNLSIIILSYNTEDLTLRCIESMISQYKKALEDKRIEIIVVDNASKDRTIEMVKKEFLNRHSGKPKAHPESLLSLDSGQDGYQTVTRQARMTKNPQIIFIQNKENFGFAKGCNIGAEASSGKYILFLNSDTEILDDGFLSMLVFLEKNPKVAILGGKLTNTDGSIQPSVGKFYNLFNLVIMLLGLERLGLLRSSPNKIKKVDWVSGACIMIRRNTFEKLEGFDEKFFMYIEDMELCFRAKKLGAQTYFYPNIQVLHKELGSSNRSFAIIHIYKGLLYFYSKHKSYFEYIIAKTLLRIKAVSGIFFGVLTKNDYLISTYKKAIKF